MRNIKKIIIYPNMLCNLNCSYCFLPKNDFLKGYDKEVSENIKDDYYINFLLEVLKGDLSTVEEVQIWGGEPSLGISKSLSFIDSLIQQDKNFSSVSLFSNMTTGVILEQGLQDIVNIFKKYPDRKFNIRMKMSIDGPPEINDIGRNEGTCKRILNNYYALIDKYMFIKDAPNVTFFISYNSTIDISQFPKFMDKGFVYSYFDFFEKKVVFPWRKQFKDDERYCFVPGTKYPATNVPCTQEDGIRYAEICRICSEIEDENLITGRYKYIKIFVAGSSENDSQMFSDPHFVKPSHNFVESILCRPSSNTIGLLPNKKISLCRRIMVDNDSFYDNDCNSIHYKDAKQYLMPNTIYDWNVLYENMMDYYETRSQSIFKNLVTEIRFLASIGQIDSKYKNYDDAIMGGKIVTVFRGSCPYEKLSITHSTNVSAAADIKLILNGADKYLLKERN